MEQEKAIRLAKRGEERGFAWLFERHRMPLFRFIRRQSNVTAEVADDILQNVFVRVFRSLGSLRQESKFEAWVLQIARRETLRYVARKKTLDSLEADLEHAAQQQEQQAAAVEKERLLTAVRELIEHVQPEAIRETARRYYLGAPCTTEQLALQLEIPHATVRKRLFLFRKKLRDLIVADWGEAL